MSYTLSNMEEHFRMNVEKKLFVKAPEQEDYELTPATRLLEKRREMLEVENGLNQQKDEFSMTIDSLKQRREELSRKEGQLKDSLLKFDKFLKENNAKRTRAIRKSLEEKKLKEAKEEELIYLKNDLTRLAGIRNKQVVATEKSLMYQKYLEGVLSSTGEEFGEIKDIIARFDTLEATNKELILRARSAQEKAEEERTDFNKSMQEKNNVILNYNNEIARLQSKYEDLQFKSVKLETEAEEMLKGVSQRTLLIGQIKLATSNLFNIVKSHLAQNVAPTSNPILQLDRVQQFIIDLDSITGLLLENHK